MLALSAVILGSCTEPGVSGTLALEALDDGAALTVTFVPTGAGSLEDVYLEFQAVATKLVLQGSSATIVNAKEARIVKSKILFFRSDSTTIEGKVSTLIHVGQACDNIKPVFDGQGALRLGAGLGIVLLIGGRLLRLLTGRR